MIIQESNDDIMPRGWARRGRLKRGEDGTVGCRDEAERRDMADMRLAGRWHRAPGLEGI